MKLTTVITLATLQIPALAAVGGVSTGLDLARLSPAVLSRDPRTLCYTWVAASGPQFDALAVIPPAAPRREPHKDCVPSACLFAIAASNDSTHAATLNMVLASQPATDAPTHYTGASFALSQLP